MWLIVNLSKDRIDIIKKQLIFIIGCVLSAQALANDSQVAYSTIPGVDCVISPYQVADLASPVTGVIERLYVERSQQVSAGQMVAQLKADIERANVELARFRAGSQSEIRLEQVNLDYDTRRKERAESLYEKQVISVDNTDEAEREVGLSRWKLEQAKELLGVRKLEFQRAKEQLQQKSIKAPFAGFVLDTFKYPGEYVEDQPILRLAQLDPLVIEAIVPMENFGKIKVGMQAEILPENLPEEKLTGTVTIVDRIGDTASNTFGVKLVMPNPENRIPAGLKCVVKFLQQTAEQTLTINEKRTRSPVPPISTDYYVAEIANTSTGESGFSVKPDHNNREPLVEEEGEKLVANVPMNNAPGRTPSSYLVLTEQGETDQQTQDIISQFRKRGIHDMQKVDHGPYKGQIMLGLYSSQGAAEKRRLALEKLGFTPSILERY